MDITPLFRDLLSARGAQARPPPPHDPARLNAFLQEAYRIHGHIADLARYLRRVRAPYLALPSSSHHHHHRAQPHHAAAAGKRNAAAAAAAASAAGPHVPPAGDGVALTDADRSAIEQSTRELLSTLSRAVDDLSRTAKAASELQAALADRARDARGLGALGRWAAGAAGAVRRTPAEEAREREERDVAEHRGGVALALGGELERAAAAQRDMLAVRYERAVERGRSALRARERRAAAAGGGGGGVAGDARWARGGGDAAARMEAARAVGVEDEKREGEEEAGVESLLSPGQIRMFEREQEEMVKFYNSELLKIRYGLLPLAVVPLFDLSDHPTARSSPPSSRSPRSRRS
jgi:syntaxin 18